jgi:uncharacterized cupin superfamily protein
VAEQPTVRRVITAQRPTGESTFAVDEEVEAIVHPTSGMSCWLVWGADDVTELPADGVERYDRTFFPSTPAGYRVHQVEFPARGAEHAPARGTWPAYGLGDGVMQLPGADGMHWTQTVDIVIVLSGEIGLAQDDGREVVLHAGDVLVQNGANHAWRPRDVPCRVCFVNLGAERRA